MGTNPSDSNQGSPRRLVLPSLVMSSFSAQSGQILTSLLLIDIGLTFGLSVGAAGQIRTLSASVAVVGALMMGVLSVRYSHKGLLMAGLLFLSVSALGCSLAPGFNVMLVAYSLTGLGLAFYSPMTTTLVGEHFPLEKRPGAIGWVVAGMSISYLIGVVGISFFANLGGWRLSFLGYVLPISLFSLLLAGIGIPSKSKSPHARTSTGSLLDGFKATFSNTSAVACLVSVVFSSAAWQFGVLYGMSFLRQRFMLSTGTVSMVMMGTSLSYTFGSLISGRLVNRLGRKTLTVSTMSLVGALTVIGPILPNLHLYLASSLVCCFFSGMMGTSSNSLTIEQVPTFRGTMMSLNSAALQLGYTFGAGAGGFILLVFDYVVLGVTLGAMGIAGATILHLLAVDPTKK